MSKKEKKKGLFPQSQIKETSTEKTITVNETDTISEENDSITKKRSFYQELMAKGYSNDMLGQGFVMNCKLPKFSFKKS